MSKTGKEIQTDIIALLRGSDLEASVSGDIYRFGQRPRGSNLEDITVQFSAGVVGQIDNGIIAVRIYVPNITLGDVSVEDGARAEELERLSQDWVNSLTTSRSNYRFYQASTISTNFDNDIDQHFVYVKLEYDYFD